MAFEKQQQALENLLKDCDSPKVEGHVAPNTCFGKEEARYIHPTGLKLNRRQRWGKENIISLPYHTVPLPSKEG